ncbi:MAG: LamG domain-containing protein, partial [Bacteroidota bacterium]
LIILALTVISAEFTAQVPNYVPTIGLKGWWPFNGNANDESGNNNNGTVNGATLTTDRFGNSNSAYGFNGVNCCGTPDPVQEILVSNQILNLGQNFTVSCWMSSSQVSKYQQCLFNSVNHCGFAVELNNEHVAGKLTYGVGNGNNWDLLYAQGSTTNFQNNTWYHVVFVKNGTSYYLYLNGSLEGTTNLSVSANYNQLAAIRFGAIGGGHEVFKGSLDDFGVWNRALTSSEIQGLQNAPAPPSPPSPPTLAVSPASTTICAGSSTTLSATANAGSSVCASS